MAAGAKADLLYGATGTYKTSNIGHAALYVWDKYQETTRLVSADGGGWEPLQPLIDAGIIEAWNIRLWPYQIESMDLACQGYWPKNLLDPKAGWQSPAEINSSPDKPKVGMLAIEGLTSFGSAIMQALKKPGVQLSQDPSYVLKDGATSYAGGSMAAFGFVQDRIYDFVMKSHMVPGVRRVLWTALEAKGEEEGTKIPIFGPAIEGKKATGKAGQWFGNMIHMEAFATEVAEDKDAKQVSFKTTVRMYLRSHADGNSKIVFPCKVRAPFQLAGELPEHMVPDLGKLYQMLDDLKKKADAEVAKKTAGKGVAAK